MKRKKSLFLILLLLLNYSPAASAEYPPNGEIININQQYKIAFTDLNNRYLQIGDIVGIYKDGTCIFYLEVLASSSAISKLAPVKQGEFFNRNVDFRTISIGNDVRKITPHHKIQSSSDASKDSAPEILINTSNKFEHEIQFEKKQNSFEEQVRILSENYVTLSNDLKKMMADKIKILSENIQLKGELIEARNEIKTLNSRGMLDEKKIRQLEFDMKIRNKDCNQEEVEKLHETLELLKKKLKKIKKLLKKEIKNQ